MTQPNLIAKRAPSERGQGRKPLAEDGELMKTRPLRMTDAEWQKCKRLGGAAWVRQQIHRAKEPTAPASS